MHCKFQMQIHEFKTKIASNLKSISIYWFYYILKGNLGTFTPSVKCVQFICWNFLRFFSQVFKLIKIQKISVDCSTSVRLHFPNSTAMPSHRCGKDIYFSSHIKSHLHLSADGLSSRKNMLCQPFVFPYALIHGNAALAVTVAFINCLPKWLNWNRLSGSFHFWSVVVSTKKMKML